MNHQECKINKTEILIILVSPGRGISFQENNSLEASFEVKHFPSVTLQNEVVPWFSSILR